MRRASQDVDDVRLFVDLDRQGDIHVSGTRTEGAVWRDGAWHEPDRGFYCEGLLVDSTCWWGNWNGEGLKQIGLKEIGATDPSERLFTHDDLSLDADAGFGLTFALGDDGILWTDTYDTNYLTTGDAMFTGLASYDGERWATVEMDDPVPGYAVDLAVAPGDGTVWVMLREDASRMTAVKWDGTTWDTYGPVDAHLQGRTSGGMHFAPDGTAWLGATTFYDGSDLRTVELPTTVTDGELRVGKYAFGPDGSVWVVLIDMRDPKSLGCEVQPDVCEGIAGLYVITPEAVAAAE
jgi:hypothetical protein